MSTSTEGHRPSGPSSEHDNNCAWCPEPCDHESWEADSAGRPVRCGDCGHRFTTDQAEFLLDRDDPKCTDLYCGHRKSRHNDAGVCLGPDDCYDYQEPAAEDPEPEEPEPDCAWCDHPAAAHSDGEECGEHSDGERCRCSRYLPRDEDESTVPEPEGYGSSTPVETPRRPPYAVAYSVQGKLFELIVPGDAAVSAEDGMLKVYHPGFNVLGIVRTMPWPPVTEGGPDGPRTEGAEG